MLTFKVVLVYQGLLFRDSLCVCVFFLGFFFQSDRPTQYQETHSTQTKKKGDGLTGQKCDFNFGVPIFERSGVWIVLRLSCFRVNGGPKRSNFHPVEH